WSRSPMSASGYRPTSMRSARSWTPSVRNMVSESAKWTSRSVGVAAAVSVIRCLTLLVNGWFHSKANPILRQKPCGSPVPPAQQHLGSGDRGRAGGGAAQHVAAQAGGAGRSVGEPLQLLVADPAFGPDHQVQLL